MHLGWVAKNIMKAFGDGRGVANQSESPLGFALGAMLASFTFFFGLGFGARLLAPFFATARAWQILDIGIALVMWAIAYSLLASH